MLKKILLAPFKLLESLADRLLTAAGALIFAQFPVFIVQYSQRLGGHVDELRLIISRYSEAAAKNGRTLEEYIGIHLKSEITDFASTGKIMSENMDRFNELQASLNSLLSSTGVMKPVNFIHHLDYGIFRATLKEYVPGISFSLESLAYAAAGALFVMAVYFLIKKSLQILVNKISDKTSGNPGYRY